MESTLTALAPRGTIRGVAARKKAKPAAPAPPNREWLDAAQRENYEALEDALDAAALAAVGAGEPALGRFLEAVRLRVGLGDLDLFEGAATARLREYANRVIEGRHDVRSSAQRIPGRGTYRVPSLQIGKWRVTHIALPPREDLEPDPDVEAAFAKWDTPPGPLPIYSREAWLRARSLPATIRIGAQLPWAVDVAGSCNAFLAQLAYAGWPELPRRARERWWLREREVREAITRWGSRTGTRITPAGAMKAVLRGLGFSKKAADDRVRSALSDFSYERPD